MEIKIKSKYLIFPVNRLASKKKLTFSENGKTAYQLDVKLDLIAPQFSAYVDVQRFIGQTLTVSVTPEMPVAYRESDTMDVSGVYEEEYRPKVHFTTKNGWNNDPNGLVYLNGEYHMFYQHNPCDVEWANMHWGHAVSRDLMHWEEKDVALFPDETGAMFSGSAILDEKGITEFSENGSKAALLFYTATSPYSQYIAYSADGLKTVKKREGAVIPHIVGSNRDPKVVFCEEWNAYALALYLEKDIFGIFRSDDLINWRLIQKISISGDNECPDIFPINDNNGKRKWVLIGAHDRYLVGEMNATGFVPLQEALTLHYGKSAYAGQSFSGLPGGRVVRVDWDKTNIKTPRFCSQMGFPCDLTLTLVGDTYYLAQNPILEIETLFEEALEYPCVQVSDGKEFASALKPEPYFIRIDAKKLEKDTVLKLDIFGRSFTVNAKDNTVSIERNVFPLSISGEGLKMDVIVDRLSFEIYLDGGRVYASFMEEATVPDHNLPTLKISSSGVNTLDAVRIYRLGSIWGE